MPAATTLAFYTANNRIRFSSRIFLRLFFICPLPALWFFHPRIYYTKTIMNEKKQRILDAGLNEFSASRYEDASLNHIIEQADVSKGTFYHYFADKMALYLDLVELSIHKKTDYINALLDPAYRFNPEDDFFTMLKKQTMADIGFLRTEPVYYHFTMRIAAEEDHVKSAVRERHGWRLDGGVADMIEIAYLKGEFNTKFP